MILFIPCNYTPHTVPTIPKRQGSTFFGVNGAAKVIGAIGAGANRCNNVGARAVSLNFLADGIPRTLGIKGQEFGTSNGRRHSVIFVNLACVHGNKNTRQECQGHSIASRKGELQIHWSHGGGTEN